MSDLQVLDGAIFVALFLGIVGTVFAMGEAQDPREAKFRHATLYFCAVMAFVMMIWLILILIQRVVEVVHYIW
jgi:hypothetical protein